MFTGLVQAVGEVRDLRRSPHGLRLLVKGPAWELTPGESIAVNGCCLTLAGMVDESIAFDVVQETMDKTALGAMKSGSRVNLERSLRAGDLMGGHHVQGHVDGTGVVARVQKGDWRVWLTLPRELMKFMVPKGSVCVDGVSLTLASVDAEACEVSLALIPTTLEQTTLGSLAEGDRVNIEADVMVKTMVHYLEYFGDRRS